MNKMFRCLRVHSLQLHLLPKCASDEVLRNLTPSVSRLNPYRGAQTSEENTKVRAQLCQFRALSCYDHQEPPDAEKAESLLTIVDSETIRTIHSTDTHQLRSACKSAYYLSRKSNQ